MKKDADKTFDELAKEFGVTIEGGTIKIPFDIDYKIFQLLIQHYKDKMIGLSNMSFLLNLIKKQIMDANSLEEAKEIMEGFSESFPNIFYAKESNIIPIGIS